MSRRRQVSEEEQALWQAIIRTVSPLKRHRKHVAPAAERAEVKQKPPSRLTTLSSPRALAAPQKLAPKPKPKEPALAPLDRRAKQRPRRGTQPSYAKSDLHHRTHS